MSWNIPNIPLTRHGQLDDIFHVDDAFPTNIALLASAGTLLSLGILITCRKGRYVLGYQITRFLLGGLLVLLFASQTIIVYAEAV